MSKQFKNMSWNEKAKVNPLYAVMTQDDIFLNYSTDPSTWKPEDLEKLRNKGRLVYESFIRPTILRANIPLASMIVEYGSGVGTILDCVRRGGNRVAGIDISPKMLEYSRIISPAVSDLYPLNKDNKSGLPDNCADMVYTRAVMHHIKKLSAVEAAVREMARVLKPGGILKMHCRTMDNVFNLENVSFTVLPFRVMQHTNWVGVPLAMITAAHLPESAFQQQVVDIATRLGYKHFHVHDSRRSDPGWPDIVFAHDDKGRLVFVEIKSDDGEASPEQTAWHDTLAKCDMEIYLVYPRHLDEIIEILMLNEKPGKAQRMTFDSAIVYESEI
jgi:SAM-dependent methyltransferase